MTTFKKQLKNIRIDKKRLSDIDKLIDLYHGDAKNITSISELSRCKAAQRYISGEMEEINDKYFGKN